MNTDTESWLTPLIAKHPVDTLRILGDICTIGLRNGEVSAADLPEYALAQKNVIGAAFKTARKLGFTKTDRIAKSERKCRHGGLILVWELTRRDKAEAFIARTRRMLVDVSKEQLQLAM